MLISDLAKEYLLILNNKIAPLYKAIPKDWNYGSEGDVVLLIGLNENWYFLHIIAKFLNSKGYRIHIPGYNSRGKIINNVEYVRKYIESNKLKNIILIGHSKGGIVARYLLKSKISKEVSKTIIIATPNNGTKLAYLKIFNLYELQPNSLILKNLRKEANLQIYNIFPTIDNHVIPNSSLKLKGANNIEIHITGHTRIVESKALLNKIESILVNRHE